MRVKIGAEGRLAFPLPTTCCNYVIPANEHIKIMRRVTDQRGEPRIAEVLASDGFHKVKLSKVWFKNEQDATENKT